VLLKPASFLDFEKILDHKRSSTRGIHLPFQNTTRRQEEGKKEDKSSHFQHCS
jgi:hypothetical protein